MKIFNYKRLLALVLLVIYGMGTHSYSDLAPNEIDLINQGEILQSTGPATVVDVTATTLVTTESDTYVLQDGDVEFYHHQDDDYEYLGKIIGDLNNAKNIVIPSVLQGKSVEIIGSHVFKGKDLKSVVLPETLRIIKNDAFYNNQLVEIDFPENLERIEGSAFAHNQLVEVEFPKSIEYIGGGAFGYNQLVKMEFPENIERINAHAFTDNSLNEVVVPKSVRFIDSHAFLNNNIKKLVLPENLERIERSAFARNELVEMEFPKSIEYIGSDAFSYNQLVKIELPENLEHIEESTFRNNSLNEVVIPKSVRLIARNAFSNNNIKKLVLPENVKDIEKNAFSFNEIEKLTIHSKLKSVPVEFEWENGAFAYNCIKELIITDEIDLVEGMLANQYKKRIVVKDDKNSKDFLYQNKVFEYTTDIPGTKGEGIDISLPQSLSPNTYYAYYENEIKFIENGGSIIKNQILPSFSKLIEAQVRPLRKNYHFDGWFLDMSLTDQWDYDDYILDNHMLYAKWTLEGFQVIFKDFDGKIIKECDVLPGTDAIPPEVPIVANHYFIGWDTDYKNVHYDMVITAQYVKDFNNNQIDDNTEAHYKVVFKNQDQILLKKPNALIDHSFSVPLVPKIIHKVFLGWAELGESQIVLDSDVTEYTPSKDVTYQAVYGDDLNSNNIDDRLEPIYTIAFEYMDEQAKTILSDSLDTLAELKIKEPIIEKEPHKLLFAGWKDLQTFNLDDERLDMDDRILNNFLQADQFIDLERDLATKNQQLIALYYEDYNDNGIADYKEAKHPVAFNAYDTSGVFKLIKSLYVLDGYPIGLERLPKVANRKKYIFSGWTNSANTENDILDDSYFKNEIISGYLSLNALYDEDFNENGIPDKNEPVYKVTYENYNGTVLKEEFVLTGLKSNPPKVPSRKGYDFIGWSIRGIEWMTIESDHLVKAEFELSGSRPNHIDSNNGDDGDNRTENTPNSRAYLTGYPDGSIGPNKPLTRASLAVMLDRFYRLSYYDIDTSHVSFDDVSNEEWYGEAVLRLSAVGMVQGMPDGHFRPNKLISRGEVVTIINNTIRRGGIFSRPNVNQSFYNPYKDIHDHWSAEAIVNLQLKGQLVDFTEENFEPDTMISRCDTVLLLNRYFGYSDAFNPEECDYGQTVFSDIKDGDIYYHHMMLASTPNVIRSDFVFQMEENLREELRK